MHTHLVKQHKEVYTVIASPSDAAWKQGLLQAGTSIQPSNSWMPRQRYHQRRDRTPSFTHTGDSVPGSTAKPMMQSTTPPFGCLMARRRKEILCAFTTKTSGRAQHQQSRKKAHVYARHQKVQPLRLRPKQSALARNAEHPNQHRSLADGEYKTGTRWFPNWHTTNNNWGNQISLGWVACWTWTKRKKPSSSERQFNECLQINDNI